MPIGKRYFRSAKPYPKSATAFKGRPPGRKVTKIVGTVAKFSSSAPYARGNLFKNPRTIQEGKLPFNSMGLYRLPFSSNFHITANGTSKVAAGTYTFNLTGPYDPRIEVGGLQPIQYDQVSPMYERYWVHKARVNVTFSNPTQDGLVVGCRVRGSTNPIDAYGETYDELKEMDLNKIGVLNNTGSQKKSFSFFIKPYQILGITKGQYNNIEYSAQTNTVPNVNVVLEPYAIANANDINDIGVTCYVSIVYYVQMTNKVTVLDA